MGTTTTTPGGPPPADTRWLCAVRIAALATVLCIGIADAVLGLYDRCNVGLARVYPIFMFPVFLGYIWVVVGLWGRKVKNGLALGLGLGSLAPLILVLTVALLGDPEFKRLDWVLASSVGLLLIPQVAVAGTAIKTYYTLPREATDKATLRVGLGKAAVVVAIFAILWIGSNGLLGSRIVANQVSAVGSLRMINTAEIVYVDTYKAGYSPTLAALGPPPTGGSTSPSAAGMIDGSLAGCIRCGYTFTYSAGPKDAAGHIKSYTVAARPINDRDGTNSYFTDQTALIRRTSEDRPATAKDPVIGQ